MRSPAASNPHWSNLTRKVLELLFQAAQQAEIVSPAEAEAALQQAEPQTEVEPNPETLRYMAQQAALYEAQREHLLKTHAGQYVLFEDGKVLDADIDFETLILRIFAETGPRDVFIQQVPQLHLAHKVAGQPQSSAERATGHIAVVNPAKFLE